MKPKAMLVLETKLHHHQHHRHHHHRDVQWVTVILGKQLNISAGVAAWLEACFSTTWFRVLSHRVAHRGKSPILSLRAAQQPCEWIW